MDKALEGVTRQQVAEFLPEALQKSLESYYRFSASEIPDDAKGFSAHHTACKVAIAHIELLLKLAKWADLPEKGEKDYRDLKKSLSTAEENLRQYHENYPDE